MSAALATIDFLLQGGKVSKVSRRDLLKYIGLGAAAVTLGACKPAATPAPSASAEKEAEAPPAAEAAGESITLRWVTNHGVAEMPMFEKVAKNFEDRNENIKIDLLNIPGGNEYYNAINTQAVGGDTPDLFYCRSYDTQPFASKGWIVNLDPFIDAFGIDTNDFWDGMRPHLLFEDSFYALPYDFSTMGFYYNKNILAEMGIETPPDDWDLDLFEEICEKMVVWDGDRVAQWATTLESGDWYWVGHIVANGGQMWSDDWKTCTLDADPVVEIFERFIEMRKKGIFPEGGAVPQGVNAWPSGLAVMNHNGSWATAGLREQVGDAFEFDVTGMPYNPKTGMRLVSGAGGAWSVGVNTKNLDEAAKFCDHVASTESCNILIAEPVRSLPGRKSSAELWIKNATEGGMQPANVGIFARQNEEKIAAEPYPPFWKDFQVVWSNRIPAMLYGGGDAEVDVREQLALVTEETQAAIDLYWESV